MAALKDLLLSPYPAFAQSFFYTLLLSAVNTSTGSFIFFLEDYLPPDCMSQPWKQGNLVALPSYRFCRRLVLKTVSGADCVYMQAGSLESSRCSFLHHSCVCLHRRKLRWPSAASPGRASQGGSEVGEQPPSPLVHPCKDWACFTYTEMTRSGKKKPSTTTLKLTLHRSFFTHTEYFAVLAIIIAHIQM